MTYYQPVAICIHKTGNFRVSGPDYYDLETCYHIGDSVNVLFSGESPRSSEFLNLSGFWFSNYIYKLMFLTGFSIFIYSFIYKSQRLIIRFQKKNDEKFVQLTAAEKDPALIKKLKWAREAMFKKRRRQ